MPRCSGYSTVAGCRRCTVDLEDDEDLQHLRPLSIAMIARAMLRLHKQTTYSGTDIKKVTINCSGIIRKKKSKTQLSRVVRYSEILFRWADANSNSAEIEDIYLDTIRKYAAKTENMTDSSQLAMLAEELVSVLQSLLYGELGEQELLIE